MDSNVSELDNCSQYEKDRYVTENESCDNEYDSEEVYNSSRGNS